MRLQLNTRIHPLADLVFNPAARRGDADWRVLYIGSGDGGSGESSRPDTRGNPQRLDTLVGKILRIVPDLADTRSTSTVSDNGRYRIPNDNPFVSIAGARKEIWALGFRNPHRLHWAIDPANPRHNRLIVNSIGMRTWETVNIVHRGANYGYSQREGNEAMKFDNLTEPRPEIDRIPMQINATETAGRSRRRIRSCSIRTSPAAATRSAAAICIAARTFPRCAASTCSAISQQVVSGTWTTRSC